MAIHSSKTSNTSSSGTFADTQKKKKQTLKEHVAKREAEQQGKQNAWQSFNNKAAKKKVIGKFPVSINKKSIFATVDDPFGKVIVG